MKRGCIVLAVLTAMWWIAGVLVDIFQCSPISKAFNPAMTPDGCIDQNAYCMGSKQIPHSFSVHLQFSQKQVSAICGSILKLLLRLQV